MVRIASYRIRCKTTALPDNRYYVKLTTLYYEICCTTVALTTRDCADNSGEICIMRFPKRIGVDAASVAVTLRDSSDESTTTRASDTRRGPDCGFTGRLDTSDGQRRIAGYEEAVGVPLFRTAS